MIYFLDHDHPNFADSPSRLAQVKHALLEWAIRGAASYRMEFDYDRLRSLIGPTAIAQLFPRFSQMDRRPAQYDLYSGELDGDLARRLLQLLTSQVTSGREPPFTYIRSVRLLDHSGRTRLRVGDHNDVHLLDLDVENRRELVATLDALGAPRDALQDIDIDIDNLEP